MSSSTGTRSLDGKRIAITGAGRGIGRATADELHRRGALVAIGDIDVDAAKDAATAIGSDVTAHHVDVTDSDSFAAFLADAKQAMGGLDVLVNNAGVMPIGHFLDIPESTVRRAAEINLLGPTLGMRAALPDMLAQGRGHIVNVASVAGKAAVPGGLYYCSHKAGVIALTEGARLEFGGRGIDFTCVMPSFTNTDLIAGTKGTKFLKNVEPEDVARGIAEAIEHKHKDVYLPRSLRQITFTQTLTGRRLRDFLNRRLGAYDTFLDIDQTGRAAYNDRINKS
ncbi:MULTISPECIES: SDR family oxidoreductase [unclassified Nocardioides]|jgi:NAD(P)-dependent dehydrogenase (short-subunit alcohol dehydrogenase family)|uniref:SDR family oxidoreductase n=1 Tax=unclassified Nocardioides TaxID=2615069 RepID=UPI00070309D5|nr:MULTISPECIES: SDR family oxidoreductase [unclassified Nocardioides]KRC54142.1 short-chain dehydrogenase [Nocardioides sp. Root79]KRC71478.1 short-chain dehydrogenase [Nocardioides sp. Root240]